MNPEILRSLSGDHDLLWLLPADLQVGDVLLHGGALVRTVLAPPVTMERGEHPADLWGDGFVSVQVTRIGNCWELSTETAVLALRPIECEVCGRPERHDPVSCARWHREPSQVDIVAWSGTSVPF